MKKFLLSLAALFAPTRNVFAQPTTVNIANEGETANATPAEASQAAKVIGASKDPAAGVSFDFRKMVLSLLGLPEDADQKMVNEAYEQAMNCEPGEDFKKLKANEAQLTETTTALQTANEKLTETANTLTAANEAKAKVETEINAVNAQLTAANERVIKAEANAANARQSLRKFIGAALIKEGRLTKAQWDKEEAELSKPEFANAEQFDARVQELSKRESTFGVTSSIVGMLNELGEMNANKGNVQTAANEVQKLVANEMAANPKMSYDEAWANVKRTEKGKGLLAQMAQPKPQ